MWSDGAIGRELDHMRESILLPVPIVHCAFRVVPIPRIVSCLYILLSPPDHRWAQKKFVHQVHSFPNLSPQEYQQDCIYRTVRQSAYLFSRPTSVCMFCI